MSVSSLMRKMAEAGAPLEAIMLAVEAIEALDAIEAQRKAKDALKTALYRQRGGGAIPDELRQLIYKRDGYVCVYCGTSENLTCDHILAVSRGGGTTENNLATACRSCNSRKRDRDRKYVLRHSADINGHPKKVGGSPRNVVKDNGPIAQDFAAFWEIWPNRVGKAEAERSFRNIGKRPDYDLAVILSGVRRYIADKPSDRGWLNPATFLNQRRWNDEPAAPTNGNHGGVIAALGRLDFGDDDIFARPEPMPSTSGKGPGSTPYGLLPKG